jgi:hypothetical protein
MHFKTIALNIVNYYNTRRQKGHTWTVMHGARSNNAIVVAATSNQAKQLKQEYYDVETILSLANLQTKMRGADDPLILDHYAVSELLLGLVKEIDMLEEVNKELREKLYH